VTREPGELPGSAAVGGTVIASESRCPAERSRVRRLTSVAAVGCAEWGGRGVLAGPLQSADFLFLFRCFLRPQVGVNYRRPQRLRRSGDRAQFSGMHVLFAPRERDVWRLGRSRPPRRSPDGRVGQFGQFLVQEGSSGSSGSEGSS
jgi:hypothetical protein